MSPDALFQIANPIALAGWIALALSPLAPRALGLLAGTAVPLVLSAGYAAIVLAHWSSGQGGFDSLKSVEQLFQSRWLLLAGWVHYLAFDLLLGAWAVRTARREGISHGLVLPCLLATFLFGPAGYLLFQFLRAGHRSGAKPAAATPAAAGAGLAPAMPGPAPAAPRRGGFSMARLAADSPRYTPLAIVLALAVVPLFGALMLDARVFQGINVWIKPIKFHVALVVYLLTLAWFARFAAPEVTSRPWWRWHERAVVVAVVLELIWIVGAAALATGSHYNRSTQLMGAIYAFMGLAAILLTSASATLAVAIRRNRGSMLSPAVRAGLVWGLGLTLPLTLVTAGTLSAMGSHWVGGAGSDAGGLALMGWARDGGDLRVSHFFATHAMHVVPLAALGCARLLGREALMPVRAVGLAYAAFVAATFVQALMGRPFLAA
jgi:hypothetical protein